MDVMSEIKTQIETHPIILYIKGTPQQPRCGFSLKAVQILNACGKEFMFVDILERSDIRQALPGYANWPTFPQLYVKGELVGGCDIMSDMFESGELQTLLASV